MSSPADHGTVTNNGVGVRAASVSAPYDRRDSWLRIESSSAVTLPPAGQPGHGRTAFVRRQPVRIVDGHFEGGYTDVFELICPTAAITRTWTIARCRRGFNGSADRARWRRQSRLMRSTSDRFRHEWGQRRKLMALHRPVREDLPPPGSP